MSKFTKKEISVQEYIMGTAAVECAIELNLNIKDVYTYQQKDKNGKTIEGVWYLVGKEKDENGKPKTIYFRKDFRK